MVIDTGFHGFAPDALAFLAELARHNERDWFQPRKGEYERLLKTPMEALVAELGERFEVRGLPLHADPQRAVSRIYRDTRFARDKSPYKTRIYATFPWTVDGDAPTRGNGGYLAVEPGGSYVGGGMWMPDAGRLAAFRQAIVDDPDRVRGALEDERFLAAFGPVGAHETLKRVPRGLPADHPMADLFLLKDVVFGRALHDDEVTSPALPDTLVDAWAAATPVFRFLATLGR